MIYPKEYLEEMVKEKSDYNAWKRYPFRTYVNQDLGEKSAVQLISHNMETFFDLNSDTLKEKMYASRKEILNNCFRSEWIDDFYVNSKKINQCIHNSEVKHFGKYNEIKHLYFYNALDILNKGLNVVRGDDAAKLNEICEGFLFDSFKIKYFFNEQMLKNLV